MNRSRVIGQWREHINSMSNYLRDFEIMLPHIESDEEFMAAYRDLTRHCGDILDGVRLPIGGTVDDLREAVAGGER